MFEELAEESSLPFVQETAKLLPEDPCFPAVWSARLKAARASLSLREEDYRILEKLGDLLGSGDARGTAEGIGLLTAQLQDRYREAAEQARTDGKLLRSLGLLTGLAAAILLV